VTFLSDIKVSRSPGANSEWTLEADLIWIGNRDQFLVPKGFKTDFASIPRIFHSLFPKNGKHDAAAIVHDYLYAHKPLVLNKDMQYSRISRKDADGIFLKIMKELGVGLIRRRMMYRAVRVGGVCAWEKSRRQNA
jgi:hypothetical protein